MAIRPFLFSSLTTLILLSSPVTLAVDPASVSDGLKLRNIGPAVTSGRISEFAVHPERSNEYFVATSSSGLWHTRDNGISWTAMFENEGSYALGTIALNPRNPDVVWVGTGENNAQRSVGYGDGVYRSLDGGSTFTNLGLKDSGHISQIGFDPNDSEIIYVAAQGPMWSPGGDRGFYRSTDAGQSWERLLHIDEDTGANEFAIHPQRPDDIVVSSYQRRRAIWTMINGGPGSGLHKSTDGGKTWRKLTRGLPGQKDDLGRIGLAMAPSEPDRLYAIIEGSTAEDSGIWRSDDFGESWEKRSGWQPSAPFYYNEIIVDPKNAERLYAVDTFSAVSEDGGKTFTKLSFDQRHVDDHALYIDPENTEHLLIGGDGGVYESFDRGQTFRHMENLPITQFYRATPDNALPFYNVYGGTQDNNTLGAPARTIRERGITNADWVFTLGGDGFKPQIDPTNPAIVYSQYQYGNLARVNVQTGESVFISPQPESGEPALRWNWNSPLIISPHDPARLYYAAEKLFRSDDRGNSWRPVSGNLTRQLDRNALEVMGRVWSVDAVAKHDGTSVYGSIVALDESPLQEDLIYIGTDDGLLQVSADGGGEWRRSPKISAVPELALVEDVIASHHDANTAYAVFDNHKRGDFKPYVFRSRDQGKSWTDIGKGLPERGSAHTIVEDHVNPDLLFLGTEFGLFMTQDGGESWHPLKGNFPTIAVRDLEIQRRENDLVVATFGRGIYILDDYSPLRVAASDVAREEATLFPVRDTLAYFPISGGASPGKAHYSAPNPPFGAVVSYYLSDGFTTRTEERRAAEREKASNDEDTPYPGWSALQAEDRELEPTVILTIRDASGDIVRRVTGPAEQGLHRVAWDLRLPAPDPINLSPASNPAPWERKPQGPMVMAGEYSVSLSVLHRGEERPISKAQMFRVVSLHDADDQSAEPEALLAFQRQSAELKRAADGAELYLREMEQRVDHLARAFPQTTMEIAAEEQRLRGLRDSIADLRIVFSGNRTITSRQEPAPWSLMQRVNSIVRGSWTSSSAVTETHRQAYSIASEELSSALEAMQVLDAELVALEAAAERLQAPYTPGRIPSWSGAMTGQQQ